MFRVWAAAAVGIGALFAVCAGNAAPSLVGTAVSVVNHVTQTTAPGGGGALRQVGVGDQIFYGARLAAGPSSRGEFELLDKTRLVLNSNSSLLLDDLVVTSNNSVTRMALTAVTGSFRFISGDSDSDAYRISTPVSTLGIRGTAFDVFIGPGGVSAVMLLEGRVRMCPRDSRDERRCYELKRRCDVAVADPNRRSVEQLDDRDDEIGGVPVRVAFPFVQNQLQLDPRFRVRGAGRCARRVALITPDRQPLLPALRPPPETTQSIIPGPPDPPPVPDPDPDPVVTPNPPPGNPGNGRNVGNAGPSPGRGDFGGPTRGRGDTGGGGNNANSGGGNSGGGGGGNRGGGHSASANAGGGNAGGGGRGRGNSRRP